MEAQLACLRDGRKGVRVQTEEVRRETPEARIRAPGACRGSFVCGLRSVVCADGPDALLELSVGAQENAPEKPQPLATYRSYFGPGTDERIGAGLASGDWHTKPRFNDVELCSTLEQASSCIDQYRDGWEGRCSEDAMPRIVNESRRFLRGSPFRRFIPPAIVMFLVTLAVSGIVAALLYRAAVDTRRQALVDAVANREAVVTAVARRSESIGEVLPLLWEAKVSAPGIGDTGEFMVARRSGDSIQFLVFERGEHSFLPESVPFDGELAEPMRRALKGETGTVVGPDYDGVRVLAAYRPIQAAGWGIVAKMDLAEVRAPFWRAGGVAAVAAFVLVLGGALLSIRLTAPIVAQIEEGEVSTRESQRQLAALMGNLPGMAYRCRIDRKWTMVFCSEGAYDLTGYRPDELLESAVVAYGDLIHTDDRDRVWSEVHEAVESSGQFVVEYRIVSAEGRERWVWEQGNEVEPGILEGFILETTDRKRAEEAVRESEAKYRTILDNIGIGVSLISPEMRVLELNRCMREWFPEVDIDQSPICYQAFSDPPKDHVCDHCPTKETLSDGQVHEAVSETHRDGGIRHYRIVSSPILRADGEISAAIEMVDDITEQVQLEEQVRFAQKMEAVGRLAGGVAHDFNNLLQAMSGAIQIEQFKGAGAEASSELLSELDAFVDRGARLSRQLLLFSRRETPRKELLDLNRVVSGLKKLLSRLLRENIELEVRLCESFVSVSGDPGQLEQVLVNLAVNAADAMSGGGRLSIRTGLTDGWAWFQFSDSGHGIPEELHDRVFEPFFTTKERHSGTGLGLAVVHGIVSEHGGRIELDSSVGVGTTFTVSLPLASEKADLATAKRSRSEDVEPGRGECVLLVEDDGAARTLIGSSLEALGYEVTAVASGEEAEQLPIEAEFHLLLSDCVLPGISGPVLAGRLLKKRPGLGVVLMTGYADEELLDSVLKLGDVPLLRKPFGVVELARKLREELPSQSGSA